jgi:F-type H+-transporting ATPase subunit b
MLNRIVLMLALTMWVGAPVLRAADEVHSAETHAAGAVVADAEGHGEGHGEHGEAKPPLLPDFTSREVQLQALWVLIIFIVLLVVLYPTAWKNVLAGLKAREKRIRDDIADAEAARKKAHDQLALYNKQLDDAGAKVRDMLAQAGADAEKIATSMKMQAQQDAEEIKERATRDIEQARKNALSDIYAQAADLSTSIASKILKRNLSADDQRDLVTSSLEQFQSVGKQ